MELRLYFGSIFVLFWISVKIPLNLLYLYNSLSSPSFSLFFETFLLFFGFINFLVIVFVNYLVSLFLVLSWISWALKFSISSVSSTNVFFSSKFCSWSLLYARSFYSISRKCQFFRVVILISISFSYSAIWAWIWWFYCWRCRQFWQQTSCSESFFSLYFFSDFLNLSLLMLTVRIILFIFSSILITNFWKSILVNILSAKFEY